MSFDDWRNKVDFLINIANIGATFPFREEVLFTAATIAFETFVRGDAVYPAHVEVFANLFSQTDELTVANLSEFWQMGDEQISSQFTKWMNGTIESSNPMIFSALCKLREPNFLKHAVTAPPNKNLAVDRLIMTMAHATVRNMSKDDLLKIGLPVASKIDSQKPATVTS